MAGKRGKCGEIKVFCFFSSEKKDFLPLIHKYTSDSCDIVIKLSPKCHLKPDGNLTKRAPLD